MILLFGMNEKELAKALGAVVKRNRLAQGYSQEGFAFESGLHRTFMGMIERGQRNVTLATIFRLAAGLKIEPSALVAEVELEVEQRHKA